MKLEGSYESIWLISSQLLNRHFFDDSDMSGWALFNLVENFPYPILAGCSNVRTLRRTVTILCIKKSRRESVFDLCGAQSFCSWSKYQAKACGARKNTPYHLDGRVGCFWDAYLASVERGKSTLMGLVKRV